MKIRTQVNLLVITFIFGYVLCESNSNNKLLKYVNKLRGDGYDFEYETSNGVLRIETGTYKSPSPQIGVLAVKGEYSFSDPDDQRVHVTFVADENGYRPKFEIGYKKDTVETVPINLADRINFDEPKSISSAAMATLAGGGIGK